MGSGQAKAHESFVVAPGTVLEAPGPQSGAPLEDLDEEFIEPDPAVVEQWVTHLEQFLDPAASSLQDTADGEDVADESDLEAAAELAATEIPPPSPGPADELGPAAAPEQTGADAVTPVPTDPTPGDICGTPLLVGGADLDDSLATLVSYDSPGGPREVLFATVTPEAEAKLYEALSLSETAMVAVSVDKEVAGRLPADEAHQLYEQLVTVAKSANHHLKDGDAVPDHTKVAIAKLLGTMNEVEASSVGEADQAMADHYRTALEAIIKRVYPDTSAAVVPYGEGGKVPIVTPYEVTGTVTVTEYVPAPTADAPDGMLSAQVRSATRIGATVSTEGSSSWDGKARSSAKGNEYAIDLGDGYAAVYRPYVATGAKDPDFSHRGALEIVAPQGAGHGPELVRRLGQLNLVNRPMTAAEGEWSYLRRNIEAQGLAGHATVAAALAGVDGLEDATAEVLIAERAHEAIGMDHHTLVGFAKSLRLEAEATALPEKVRVVRDAVAKAKGMADGAALAASAGYDPTPRASGGWLVWDRFDVTADRAGARTPFAKRGIYHHITNHNLVEILTNGGVLASTERRRVMGVKAGKGMSESADMGSGGAQSVFLRVRGQPTTGPALYWADPTVLLRRSDWYAYNGDHFGSLNPKSGHSTSGQTRDTATLAGFGGGSNEVMFRHGIDLLGAEAPTLIRCSSVAERASVLGLLAKRGITALGGRPVEEVVK